MIVSAMMLSCNPDDDDKKHVEDKINFDPDGEINGYAYVDLGLPSGLKWATCNVGAGSIEEYGDYYAWGEVETKTEYTESNSVTWGAHIGSISGNVKYDVARKKWGDTWRIPTKTELEELETECTWSLMTHNNVKGYKVTGTNGNSIFIPLAGCRYKTDLYNDGEYGYLWSSTPYEENNDYAYSVELSGNGRKVLWGNRHDGQSVRAVSK